MPALCCCVGFLYACKGTAQACPPPPYKHPVLAPACRRKRVNPALVATSGYVFCYTCAFKHITDHGCCPVTRFPATLDHIRKLYEAT